MCCVCFLIVISYICNSIGVVLIVVFFFCLNDSANPETYPPRLAVVLPMVSRHPITRWVSSGVLFAVLVWVCLDLSMI